MLANGYIGISVAGMSIGVTDAQKVVGDNRGLLGDLEFAKRRDPEESHEVRKVCGI